MAPKVKKGEIALTIAENGNRLICPEHPSDCTYIRVTDGVGNEIGYWDQREWQEEPAEVMGAIVGALCTRMTKRPSKGFKQQFIEDIDLLALHCASNGNSHVVSQALHDAIQEIFVEVKRKRTDWDFVAALTAVKSVICSRAKREDGHKNSFWSKDPSPQGPYAVLDRLHHEACSRVCVQPSGETVYLGVEGGGIVKQDGEGIEEEEGRTSWKNSPTLRLIAKEKAYIREKSNAGR